MVSGWRKLREENAGEKGRQRELPDAKLHPQHAHLPPLSHSHAHFSRRLPLIPSPPPTPSLFTLHRHLLINMLLPQQRGGKACIMPPTTRRCYETATHAPSHINRSTLRLWPKQHCLLTDVFIEATLNTKKYNLKHTRRQTDRETVIGQYSITQPLHRQH